MKLFIKTLCITLITTLILTSCNEKKKGHGPIIVKTDCYPNDKRPSQAITYNEMASMFKEYDNGQRLVLNNYITKRTKGRDSVATISQFFSLSELKQYIAYIERLSKEKEIELTGVRIFTAAYPSDYDKKEYRNRVSFILAPTTNIGNKKNVAYEPLESSVNKPVSMHSILDKYADETTRTVNRASILPLNLLPPDKISSALNRGTINPPPH
jgi:hypothetical protein